MHRCLALAALAAACSPAGAAPTADPQAEATAVLDRHCRRCHDGPEAIGGFDISDLEDLKVRHLIVPGDAAGSPLAQRMAAGEMPPETVPVR
ncbi:MAG TPA: c-type cytochrome domain-containing protein, partial [Kofleriaceae bacterium]|nr:c-type cytochrome domain-containing protein [Kofleriaceae bacterium]